MSTNLLLAAGAAVSVSGALFMLVSPFAIRRAATRLVVTYPGDLSRRRMRRQDRQLGVGLLVVGGISLALAFFGYSVPLSLWRYPLGVTIAAILVYRLWWFAVLYRKATPRAPGSSLKTRGGGMYETPRSMRLQAATQAQSAKMNEMEAARAPRDKGVVFLTREWDRMWWSDRLGASIDAIKGAMREVGPMTRDVERRLAVYGANVRPWPPELERRR